MGQRHRQKSHYRQVLQVAERLAAGELGHNQRYVVTAAIGSPIDPRNFQRNWHQILDIYGHHMPDGTDKVADAMDRALGV